MKPEVVGFNSNQHQPTLAQCTKSVCAALCGLEATIAGEVSDLQFLDGFLDFLNFDLAETFDLE